MLVFGAAPPFLPHLTLVNMYEKKDEIFMVPLTLDDSWMMIRFLDLYLRVNFTIPWFLHRSPQKKKTNICFAHPS